MFRAGRLNGARSLHMGLQDALRHPRDPRDVLVELGGAHQPLTESRREWCCYAAASHKSSGGPRSARAMVALVEGGESIRPRSSRLRVA
jgi:hypothetical protein